MMLHISTPAPILETMELFQGANRVLKPWQRRALAVQLTSAETVAFRAAAGAGTLLAAAGFYACPDEREGEALYELWFVCRREAAREVAGLVRGARLTFRRLAHSGPVRIRAFVLCGHGPGERLARLVGMARVGEAAGYGRWEWQGGADHQGPVRRGRQAGESRAPAAGD